MTNEEAIRILNFELDGDKGSIPNISYAEYREALNTAIRAIEKQMPLPVMKYKAHPMPIFICPVCTSVFVERNGIIMRYCNNCGQAIYAGEEDE